MPNDFYLPENPEYTIVDSARDSVRFAHYCLESLDHGKWRAMSSCVVPDGRPNASHPLGHLEGPGWAANALGGAAHLYAWGGFDNNHILQKVALGLIDHVLEDGFLLPDGFIRGYRDTSTGEFSLNPEGASDWFCTGSMAKAALQMLWASDLLPPSDDRVARLREYPPKAANWLLTHVSTVDEQHPSRCSPDGSPYGGEGGETQYKAVGHYVVWLLLDLTERGLGHYAELVREKVGSAAHDAPWMQTTADRATAFRLFRRAARFFRDPSLGSFAMGTLAGLQPLQMTDDRHGKATKGLLCDGAGLASAAFEHNAECSLAYLEAFEDTGEKDYLCTAVTILRAIARHHHGQHGFLAAGVRWGSDAEAAGLPYTHPLFSNLHHIEPALRYLERHVT